MSNKLKSVQLNKVIVSLRTERLLVMMFITLKKKKEGLLFLVLLLTGFHSLSVSLAFTSIPFFTGLLL